MNLKIAFLITLAFQLSYRSYSQFPVGIRHYPRHADSSSFYKEFFNSLVSGSIAKFDIYHKKDSDEIILVSSFKDRTIIRPFHYRLSTDSVTVKSKICIDNKNRKTERLDQNVKIVELPQYQGFVLINPLDSNDSESIAIIQEYRLGKGIINGFWRINDIDLPCDINIFLSEYFLRGTNASEYYLEFESSCMPVLQSEF